MAPASLGAAQPASEVQSSMECSSMSSDIPASTAVITEVDCTCTEVHVTSVTAVVTASQNITVQTTPAATSTAVEIANVAATIILSKAHMDKRFIEFGFDTFDLKFLK